jgi:hypothetical protein
MLGSGGSGGFAQMASQLFNNGSDAQKSGMLNTLLATAGPALIAQFLGNNAGSGLASALQGGQTQVTPDQAAQISPDEVAQLAQHVHSQGGGGVVEAMGAFYSDHPALVKSLGAAALGLVVSHLAQTHGNQS